MMEQLYNASTETVLEILDSTPAIKKFKSIGRMSTFNLPMHRNLANSVYGDESGSVLKKTVIDRSGGIKEETIKESVFEFEIDLFGDIFLCSKDNLGYSIHHSKYILFGEGKNIQEAISDLQMNIRNIKEQLIATPIETLDYSGFEFRNFLVEKITL